MLAGADMSSMREIGKVFLEETNYTRGKAGRASANHSQPGAFARRRAALRRLELPRPTTCGGPGLWGAISERRSVREFSRESLSPAEVSQLLWAVQGLTGKTGGIELRAAASAGALYPNETYVFLLNVTDCQPGLARYQVRGHALEILEDKDFARPLAEACLGQRFCAEAGVVVAWAAVLERVVARYAQRGYRYVFLDAGHLGAHLQLAATALGLGSVNVGAFCDDEVNRLLGLDGEREFAVYLTAVGKR